MTKPLSASLLGLLFVVTPASIDAAPPVPESVIWEEAIEYSSPDDEHLPLNLARPKSGEGPFPAVLCIHGTEDKYVAHEQAVWLIDKLKAATVEAELLTLEGAGHGFKGADAEKAEAALFGFFDKHLKR